jgi:hypothetical protein
MAAFEPFFFYTEGGGVIYLAVQYAGYANYAGNTFVATGAFQNINQVSDGKNIYYLDGRYTDQMNEASIHGKTNIRDTDIFTKPKMKKFIKDQGLDIDPDGVTLYSSGDFYWFVKDGVVDPVYSKKSVKKSASKSKKNSPNKTKNSPNKNKSASKRRSKSKSRK